MLRKTILCTTTLQQNGSVDGWIGSAWHDARTENGGKLARGEVNAAGNEESEARPGAMVPDDYIGRLEQLENVLYRCLIGGTLARDLREGKGPVFLRWISQDVHRPISRCM